jgi:predicted transcriptional regulator
MRFITKSKMRNEEKIKGVMFSLHPEYWEKMVSAEKKYEFRLRLWNAWTTRIFIYATQPVGKVVGEFRARSSWMETPKRAWFGCSEGGGISKEEFDKYCGEKKRVGVIKIGDVKVFKEPLPVTAFGLSKAPQAFQYVFAVPATLQYAESGAV